MGKTGKSAKTTTATVSAPGGYQYYRATTSGKVVDVTPKGQATPSGPIVILGRQIDINRGPATKTSSTEQRWLDDHKNVRVNASPAFIKFNLPPHAWSLPVDQTLLNSNSGSGLTKVNHKDRRAIMWCYTPNIVGDSSSTLSYSNAPSSNTTIVGSVAPKPLDPTQVRALDMNWGFQFLWNPEAIGNSLSRNVNFTPNATDKTAGLYGLFTAMEGLNFNIVINRVNDFAALKASGGYKPGFEDYYKYRYNSFGENISDQITDLIKKGTMHDIEYIFRMINGDGSLSSGNGLNWYNALGRKTADVGFLSPTVVAVKFGPNPDSLSYVGYVDGLTISHEMFTEDMIPIKSTVSINYVAYARTSLTAKAE